MLCYMDAHNSGAEGTAPPQSLSTRRRDGDNIQHSNQPIYHYYTQRMERMGAESGRPSNSACVRARIYYSLFPAKTIHGHCHISGEQPEILIRANYVPVSVPCVET